jgi:hypothetical protein
MEEELKNAREEGNKRERKMNFMMNLEMDGRSRRKEE